MLLIRLPKDRDLVYYLAAEEYFAGEGYRGPAAFVWNVAPTVIIGRHQVMEKEVNLEWCKTHSVKVFRRRSGGGCVYSDRGNLMVSCISPKAASAEVFDDFIASMESILGSLGLAVGHSGRNDILVNGRKVSGCAWYGTPSGRSIIHSTLLFDSDLDALERCITPSRAKISSKGVDSVRSHVLNLKEMIAPMTREDLVYALEKGLTDRVHEITAEEHEAICDIERGYTDPAFLYGNNPAFNISASTRFEGVGELTLSLDVVADKVDKVSLSGDWLDAEEGLEDHLASLLQGLDFADLASTLESSSRIAELVPGLTGGMLASMLENQTTT